jgi:hypothetical protein
MKLSHAVAALALLTFAGNSTAGETNAAGGSDVHAYTKADDAAMIQAQAHDEAQARADLDRTRQALKARAAKVSAKAQQKADEKFQAAMEKTNASVQADGEAAVAGRLAQEFRTDADVWISARKATGLSYGELLIAHTIAANTKGVALSQIVALRSEGMGWAQMASGIGMDLNSAVRAVNGEMVVAQGAAKADGNVTAIRADSVPAAAGLGIGVGANTATQGLGVNGGLGLGVGAQIGR